MLASATSILADSSSRALTGFGAEFERQVDGALRLRLVGEPGQPHQLDIGLGRARPACHEFLELLRACEELLFEVRLAAGGIDAQHLEHAVERVERHAFGLRDGLDIFARPIGRGGDLQQQLPPAVADRRRVVARRLDRLAERQHPAQRRIGPGQLPRLGLEINLLAHQRHQIAEGVTAGGKMLEQRRSVRRVLARRRRRAPARPARRQSR